MSIIINGTGTISGVSSTGLTTAQTVTQSAIATGVAGTGPAFSAFLATDQSITSGVDTKLQFATEEWDTNSNFNNTGSTVGGNPSYSFLPTVAGYYQVEASVYPNTSVTFAQAGIYKNGSLYKRGFSSSLNGIGQVACVVYLNGTTDYISCYGAVSGTSPVISNATSLTWFQASLIRAA